MNTELIIIPKKFWTEKTTINLWNSARLHRSLFWWTLIMANIYESDAIIDYVKDLKK